MNPYDTPAPHNTPAPRRPWWTSTPAVLGALALVALISAFNVGLGFLVMIAAMVAVWVLPPWRWFAKLGSTFGALVLLTIGATLGGQVDDNAGAGKADAKAPTTSSPHAKATPSPTATEFLRATDYTGKQLDEAEQRARSAGFTTTDHDAADEARAIIVRSGWTVCFQKADTTARSIDFAAVRTKEPCPDKDGGPLPWPEMPKVVGDTYNTAVKDLKQAGIGLDQVTLDDVYLDIDAPTAKEAAQDGDEWRVCFQSPDRGGKVTSTTSIRLDLGKWTDTDVDRHCPATKDTTYKIPADDPAHDGSNSASGGNSSSSGPTSGDSSSGGSSSGGSTRRSTGGSTGGGSSSSTGGGNVGIVHPGAYCSPPGATGVTSAGTPMVCGPASDGRDRWHHA